MVAKNKKKPFYIRTSLADVKVTGTSFNVKAFSDSGLFETVLSEGSIELEFNGEHENQQVKLKPGERAVFDADRKKLSVQNVDARIYSAWRNGEIIFQDAVLSDLIKELERIYDVKFKLSDPSLGSYRFRGTFSYDNNLIDALEKFKESGVKGEFVIVIEGNLEEKEIEEIDISLLLEKYINEGFTKKEAVKKVSEETGVGKNLVYKESIKI